MVGFRGMLLGDRGGGRKGFGFGRVKVAVCQAVEVHARVIAEEISVAWTCAVWCDAVFGG